MKVLVVDDQWPMRLLVKVNLESEVVQVLEAENGTEAVELAVHELPDVILLDVMMPGMDGFEVAEILTVRPAHEPHPDRLSQCARRLSEPGPRPRDRRRRLHHKAVQPDEPARVDRAAPRRPGSGRLDELRAQKLEKLQTLFKLADLEEPGPSLRSEQPPASPG